MITHFIKHSASGGVIALLIYADDIVKDDLEGREALRKCLDQEFEIKELGRLKHFLGIEVAHTRHWIFISQQKYVLYLLTKIGKLGCKLVKTPIEQNQKLCEVVEDMVMDREPYQRLVGRLIYLSHTRPNIVYAVGVMSQFMHNPKNGPSPSSTSDFTISQGNFRKRNIIQERRKADTRWLHGCKLCRTY